MHEPVAGWKQSVMTASKPQVLANEVQQEGNWRPPQRDMHPHGFIFWGLCVRHFGDDHGDKALGSTVDAGTDD
jgi:hypothetical protein